MALADDAPLSLAQKRPACVTCSKSKRKCSKQLPACHRCRIKKIRCAYPMSPVLLSSAAQAFITALDQPIARTPPFSDDSSVAPGGEPPFQTPASNPSGQEAARLEEPWFLKPSSWEIDHIPINDDNHITYPDSGLDYFLDRMRAWLDQWTKENHCAFIHCRLYGSDLPNPLQYAFATWMSYRAATTTPSKRIALRMAQNWSKNLVQEHSIYDSLGASTVDILSHLSRTQALLIFQLIGLFDGDVRARAEAENMSPTLVSWANALLQSAGTEVMNPRTLDPEEHLNYPQIKDLQSDGNAETTWKAWILSESIRRTWIIATLTEAAFLIMKQGFAICPGSISFTGRSGLWDANSPHAWIAGLQKPSTTKIPVFCRGLSRLLDETKPSDVDDLTYALLAYGNGREKVEDWFASESS